MEFPESPKPTMISFMSSESIIEVDDENVEEFKLKHDDFLVKITSRD